MKTAALATPVTIDDAIVAALDKAGLVLLYTPADGFHVRPKHGSPHDRITAAGTMAFDEARETRRFEIWGRRHYPGLWRGDDAMSVAADLMRAGWLAHAAAIGATPRSAEDDDPESDWPRTAARDD